MRSQSTAAQMDAIKSAASGAYAAVMGSKQPSPPTESHPRHRHGSLSTDESLSRARSAVKVVEASRNDSQVRTEASDTASTLKKRQQQSRETPDSTAGTEDVLLAFQNALTQREQQLEVQGSEYRRLRDTFRKLREEYKNQREILAQRNVECKRANKLVCAIIDHHLDPYAQKNGLLPRKWDDESILAVLGSLSRDAENTSSLRNQVGALQKEMLAKVEKVEASSDEQFAKDFRVIVSLVKTLSRTVRIDDNVDMVEVLGSGSLLKDVSRHHWTGRARKKLLVEAWLWSVLIDMVFRTPFIVFGKQYEVLSAVWQGMFLAEHCNGWPSPTLLSETWRCTTMERMLGLVDRDVITHGKVKDPHKGLEPGVLDTHEGVISAINIGLAKVSSVVNISLVQNVVDKAFTLAVQMSLQRSRLQITYPKVGDKFNKDTTKLMADPDGEDINDGEVSIIINPGLTKWGDAHGKNLDHRYDIVPSLVQLEAVAAEQKTGPTF